MAPRILGVSGSLREGANTLKLVNLALEAARENGAEVELLDLREHPLPLYEAHEDYDTHSVVNQVIAKVDAADAYIIGSPEYHGCMSGASKNFFDFLYREIAGKLFGFVAATGGSQGNGCFDNMRAAVQYCHGWALPYTVAASGRDFDAEGNLANAKVADRLRRMGRDVTVYAPVLLGRFKADLEEKSPARPGFAHWLG
jgi:FMN reductase